MITIAKVIPHFVNRLFGTWWIWFNYFYSMIPLDISLITIILVTIYGKASFLKINALSQIESLLKYLFFRTQCMFVWKPPTFQGGRKFLQYFLCPFKNTQHSPFPGTGGFSNIYFWKQKKLQLKCHLLFPKIKKQYWLKLIIVFFLFSDVSIIKGCDL